MSTGGQQENIQITCRTVVSHCGKLICINQSICCHYIKEMNYIHTFTIAGVSLLSSQKPANILVMGEGPERGRVKIGMYIFSF